MGSHGEGFTTLGLMVPFSKVHQIIKSMPSVLVFPTKPITEQVVDLLKRYFLLCSACLNLPVIPESLWQKLDDPLCLHNTWSSSVSNTSFLHLPPPKPSQFCWALHTIFYSLLVGSFQHLGDSRNFFKEIFSSFYFVFGFSTSSP